MNGGLVLARASITQHSKSFALASKLLPRSAADDARVVYAWCRRVDDAIDHVPAAEQPAALARLQRELDEIYGPRQPADALAAAFQEVVRRTGIPRAYPEELLLGMGMDADRQVYATWDELLLYCYRVAGVVGLMMCHVLGVQERSALRHAAHLGIGMQLTNIARDVLEDWQRGRLYLPDALLAEVGCGGLFTDLGRPFPAQDAPAVGRVVQRILDDAQPYYESGDRGVPFLPPRTAFAIRTARLVYSDIGRVLAERNYAVLEGRVHVTGARKLVLLAKAAAITVAELPAHFTRPFTQPIAQPFAQPGLLQPLSFPHDILPV